MAMLNAMPASARWPAGGGWCWWSRPWRRPASSRSEGAKPTARGRPSRPAVDAPADDGGGPAFELLPARTRSAGHHGAVAWQRQVPSARSGSSSTTVNMPGAGAAGRQADASNAATSASLVLASAAITMASIRSRPLNCTAAVGTELALPASWGRRTRRSPSGCQAHRGHEHAGVILSQLEMHTMASAQCALTMYSTLSAITSRLGGEYSMPSWSGWRDAAVVHSDGVELWPRRPQPQSACATSWPVVLPCVHGYRARTGTEHRNDGFVEICPSCRWHVNRARTSHVAASGGSL